MPLFFFFGSELAPWARAKVRLKLLAKTLNVSREIRKRLNEGSDDIFHWRKIVLNIVENVAGDAEVGDRDIIACNEFLRLVLLEALLADLEELGGEAFLDGSHGSGFLVTRSEKSSLHRSLEQIGISLNNHVDEAGLLPIILVIVAVHLAKGAKQSTSLLASLTTEMDDGEPTELSNIAARFFKVSPIFWGVADELVVSLFVLEHLADRVDSAVGSAEVFDLE